jgi:hypothetical protein
MTATLADDKQQLATEEILGGSHFNWFIGNGQGTPGSIPAGPSVVVINDQPWHYEQYQALTLWGLRKMSRREVAVWRIKRMLRRSP